MSIWSILSWVFVGILTGINIFIFLKLQKTMKSMLTSMFPGASSVEDAASKMANMMQMFTGGKGMPGIPGMPSQANSKNMNNALDLLAKLQQQKTKR
jgi:hypothetical protein